METKEKAKIKAKELFDKFYLITKDSTDILKIKSKAEALTCSLTCVNEILQTFNTNCQWCSVAMEDKALWSKEFEFWKLVKEQLISYENQS
jgi:hypothetical protein